MIMESIQDRPRWLLNAGNCDFEEIMLWEVNAERMLEERSSRKYQQMLGRLRHKKNWEEMRAKKTGVK